MNHARLRLPFLAVFAFLALLAGRLFCVQVLQGGNYVELAKRQFTSQIKTESYRGDINDRNGNILATTVETGSVFANPREIESKRGLVEYLKNSLALESGEVNSKITSNKSFVWLRRRMNPEQVHLLAQGKVKGVGVVMEQNRYYPNGPLACHLLGSVGMDNQALSGIEQSMDSFLKGKQVVISLLRDGKGRKFFTRSSQKSADRNDLGLGSDHSISLTIDRSLQYVAESEVQSAVERLKAKRGMAVIQNPKTGEILAMASYPAFDPNIFPNGKTPKGFKSVWIQNPAVSELFEPGSTFKIVAFAAAIEGKSVKKDQSIFCENGKWKVGNITIRDHEPKGSLTFEGVMENSSNIGTGKIALQIGKETLYRTARAFGFGTKTGISIPGETSGLLKEPAGWSQTSLPVIAFGQEVSVTAVQLVNAFSTLANGGLLMEPVIIRQLKSVDGDQASVTSFGAQTVRRVISESTAKEMRNILRGVVEKGTGLQAKVPGYSVAGKTGTAQKIDPATGKYHSSKYVASFCGFLPANDPQLVCLVVLDEPKTDYWGGTTAAPVFSKIMARATQILGIAPDLPLDTPPAVAKKPSSSPAQTRLLAMSHRSKD
jgi:cell division protein FtsI (penicillin-binding protein 3)